MEQNDKQEEKQDLLDLKLSELVDEVVGEKADEEEWDEASTLLFDVIYDLVDSEEIEDVPANDATDEIKNAWLEKSYPILKKELQSAANGSDDDSEEEEEEEGE